MKLRSNRNELGVSLTGLIVVLILLSMLAIMGMKVFPSVNEYMAAKRAINYAKTHAKTPGEAKLSFDKQADINLIHSISGKDLTIAGAGNNLEISFEYQKKISLVGPVSLLIDYAASTVPTRLAKKKPEN